MIDELVEQLKAKRKRLEYSEAHIASLEEELTQSPVWQELQRARSLRSEKYMQEANEIDNQLRELAIQEYQATGNKNPHDKVSIIIAKLLTYDDGRAIRWAIDNAWEMLKLDAKLFEKHARAVADTMPLRFVDIADKPQVRIAKEL